MNKILKVFFYFSLLSLSTTCFGFAVPPPPPDTTPPVVTPPPNIKAEATGPLTAVSLGAATAIDGPTSGGSIVGIVVSTTSLKTYPSTTGPFAVGTHKVIWTATDAAGNTGSAVQYVTIVDTTPPVVSPPANIRLNAKEASVPVDLGTATASDRVDGVVVTTPISTGPFPIGTHYITWSATDKNGNIGTARQRVIVTQYTQQDLDPLELLKALRASEEGDETALLRFLLSQPDVQESLKADGINALLRDGELVLKVPTPPIVDNGCFGWNFPASTITVTLKKGANIQINDLNISERLAVEANLAFTVSGAIPGKVRELCLFENSTTLTVSGGFTTKNTVFANIKSELSDNEVTLDVESGFTGYISNNTVDVSLARTGFYYQVIGLFFDFVNPEKGAVTSAYRDFVNETDASVKAEWDGTHQFTIPDIGNDLKQLADLLKAHPALVTFIQEHRYELLYYLLTAQKQSADEVLSGIGACAVIDAARARSMPHTPLYHLSGGACTASDPFASNEGEYYTDALCTNPIAFKPTSLFDTCNESLSSSLVPNVALGNANWQPDVNQIADVLPQVPSRSWTMPIGPTVQVGLEPIAGNHSPYMKRIRYKSISNVTNPDGFVKGTGTCDLEMRVYKKDPLATNLKPILAFHGGSWQLREGFNGLEAQISNFTEKGFIVFAPFYRLASEKDGNPECNGVTNIEITQDAEDALTWVMQNGLQLGADLSQGVSVTGQSAGGHLAGWLVTHRPYDVYKGLLIYPPVDFLDYQENAIPGGAYENWLNRLDILTTYFNVANLAEVPYEQMLNNSFPRLVNPTLTPPVYMLIGTNDSYVPAQNNMNMCNAYNSSPASPLITDGTYRDIYSCGSTGGQLHLFEGADHIFDLFCLPGIFCPAGSIETANEIADSLRLSRDWLLQ